MATCRCGMSLQLALVSPREPRSHSLPVDVGVMIMMPLGCSPRLLITLSLPSN
jgi:hypothetical protein